MSLWIRGGRVVDPSADVDRNVDLWIEGGVVLKWLEPSSTPPETPTETFDASGLVVAPGLIDLHVHLREPGQVEKEDIESGTKAAVAGGFTSILCMPNTTPTMDSVQVVRAVVKRAAEVGKCRVYPVGAVTKGLVGKDITHLEELKDAGCVAFSDDGRPVWDSHIMKEALERIGRMNSLFIEHCEEPSLSAGPTVHDGDVAKKMGLAGIPRSAETVDVVRTLMLASETGARVHLGHLSCAASVDLLRTFRKSGTNVSAEVTPHHLTLTDAAVETFGTNAKMYPPLRTEDDVKALRTALSEGVLDAVATDHAPHTAAEKSRSFSEAPNGVIGLESALPVLLTLVASGEITLLNLIDRMSTRPARIAGIPGGTLREGAVADFVVFDPDETNIIDRSTFFSKSRNTPLHGFCGRGKVKGTWVGGRRVFP